MRSRNREEQEDAEGKSKCDAEYACGFLGLGVMLGLVLTRGGFDGGPPPRHATRSRRGTHTMGAHNVSFVNY